MFLQTQICSTLTISLLVHRAVEQMALFTVFVVASVLSLANALVFPPAASLPSLQTRDAARLLRLSLYQGPVKFGDVPSNLQLLERTAP